MRKGTIALAALLASLALAGCDNGSSSTSENEGQLGLISYKTPLPTDLALNQSLDLDQFLDVQNVDSWSLRTEDNEVVAIEGHKVIAKKHGDFLVTIVAGSTKRAYQGSVVTDNKLLFNEVINKFNDNYESFLLGPSDSKKAMAYYSDILHHPDYFARLSTISNAGVFSFRGEADGYEGKGHAFTFDSQLDELSFRRTYSEFKAIPGYSYGTQYVSFGSWKLKGEQFKEKTTTGENGEVTSVIYFEDSVDTSAGDSKKTYVSQALEVSSSFSLSSIKESLSDTYVKGSFAGLVADFNETTNSVSLVFTDDKFELPAKDDIYFSLNLVNPQKIHIAEVEEMLTKSSFPKGVTTEELADVSEAITTNRKYRALSVGQWQDSEGNFVECPEDWHYSDVKNDILWNYSSELYVDGDNYYDRITSISTNIYEANKSGLLLNYVNAYSLKDGMLYGANGFFKEETHKNEWNKSSLTLIKDTSTNKELTTLWQEGYTFNAANLTKKNSSTVNAISKETSGSKTTFTVNELSATSSDNSLSPYVHNLIYIGGSRSMYQYYRLFSFLQLNHIINYSISVDNLTKTLEFTMAFRNMAEVTSADGTKKILHYIAKTTIDKIGEDNLATNISSELWG